MTLLILVVAFFVLIVCGMPIAFAIGVSSLCAILYQGMPIVLLSHYLFAGVDSFILCAVPMFILAGEIMLQGGLTRSLTDFADILVGRIRGGLGHTNIMASMFLAGISGSATADAAAIGSLLIPAMADRGYSRAYSTAVTIAGAIIGPIIPPSLTFVIYAMAVGRTSIGGLFMAGIVPGILTGLALMFVNYRISKKRKYEKRTQPYTKKQIWDITSKSSIVLVMPVLIVGGILTGIYTATESAAVASAYALIIGFAFFRMLKLSQLPQIFINSAKITAIFVVLLATSNIIQLHPGNRECAGPSGQFHARSNRKQVCLSSDTQLHSFHHRLRGGSFSRHSDLWPHFCAHRRQLWHRPTPLRNHLLRQSAGWVEHSSCGFGIDYRSGYWWGEHGRIDPGDVAFSWVSNWWWCC